MTEELVRDQTEACANGVVMDYLPIRAGKSFGHNVLPAWVYSGGGAGLRPDAKMREHKIAHSATARRPELSTERAGRTSAASFLLQSLLQRACLVDWSHNDRPIWTIDCPAPRRNVNARSLRGKTDKG